MNWLSAARRQKKKSRRRADTFSRAYETAALIFRAAVSLRVRLGRALAGESPEHAQVVGNV